MSARTVSSACSWLLAAHLVVALGCGEKAPITSENSKFEVADTNPADPADERGPISISPPESFGPGAASDPQNLTPLPDKPPVRPGPSGDVATDLLDEISQPPQPQGITQQQAMESLVTQIAQRIGKSEQVLQMETTPENRMRAFQIKLKYLHDLVQLNQPKAQEHMLEFCQAAQSDSQTDIARLANLLTFGLLAGEFAAQPDGGEFGQLRDLMSSLLDQPDLKPGEVQAMFEGVLQVLRADKGEKGQELVDMMLAKLGDHPELGQLTDQLPDVVKIAKSQFEAQRDAFLDHEPDSLAPLMETARALLKSDQPGATILNISTHLASDVERAGHLEEARELYELLQAAYGESEDEAIAEQVKTVIECADKRFALPGKMVQVRGTLHTGQPLDWSKYKGQKVLVHFWSPNSRTSFQEIAQIRNLHTVLKDRGLAVIGVAIGQPQMVQQRLELQPLPWETTVDDFQSEGSFARECGAAFVPYSLLLDAQGKVIGRQSIESLPTDLDEIAPPAADPAASDNPAPPVESVPEPSGAEDSKAQDTSPNSGEKDSGEKGSGANDSGQKASGESGPDGDDAGALQDGPPLYFVSLLEDPPAESQADQKEQQPPVNVYLAREGLSPRQLIDFLFGMEDKPKSIQSRPGFGEAVVEAADRILAADTDEKYKLIAAETKFAWLHRMSVAGHPQADQQLAQFIEAMKDDTRPSIARQVRFLQLERRVMASDDLELDQIPALLEELAEFFQETKLTEAHLRIASSTVHAINRLEDDDRREELFKQFGDLFAKSSDRDLERYGKRLAGGGGGPSASDLVGKPLELQGATALGPPLDWASYRGKVVIVDFWATWCPPCVREMPHVKAYYEKNKDRGLDIVGVSLDKDLEALAKFLEDHEIAWTTLLGEETQELAAKYGVRGIPTMMLVDREGKVVAVSHNIAELQPQADQLLEKAAE